MICPISLEQIKSPYKLGCTHTFEKTNIMHWLKTHDTCPICRWQISEIETILYPFTLKCYHTFEKQQIFKWLETHDTCPLCDSVVTSLHVSMGPFKYNPCTEYTYCNPIHVDYISMYTKI